MALAELVPWEADEASPRATKDALDTVQLRVSALTGALVAEFELPALALVAAAKERLCELAGVPTWEQRLVQPQAAACPGPLPDGCRVKDLAGGAAGPIEVSLIRVERHLAISWAADLTLRLWDLSTGAELHNFGGDSGGMATTEIVVDPDWQVALSWGHEKALRLWDVQRGVLLESLRGHSAGVLGVDVDWEQCRALSWARDRTLRLWDLQSRQGIELRGHAAEIGEVLVGWTLNRALSAAAEEVLLWDLEEGTLLQAAHGLVAARVWGVDPLWTRALIAGDGRPLQLWDWDLGGAPAVVHPEGAAAREVGVEMDWETMRGIAWSEARGGVVWLWDHKAAVATFEAPGVFHLCADWANSRVASWSLSEGTLQTCLWDLGRGPARLLPRKGGMRTACAAAPGDIVVLPHWKSCRALTWSCKETTAKLWDLDGAGVVHELAGHNACLSGVEVDWKRERALTWSAGGSSLRMWDLAAGTLLREMLRDAMGSFGVQLDWERSSALSWTQDRWGNGHFTLELWDVDTGALLRVLSGHSDVVLGAALAPERARFTPSKGPLRLAGAGTGAKLSGTSPLTRLYSDSIGFEDRSGARLLSRFVTGGLTPLVAELRELLRSMPEGPAPPASPCDGERRARCSGAPNPPGEYLPLEEPAGRATLLMCGSGSVMGAPATASAPLCAALAAQNAAALVVDNSGWPGLMAASLARPQDFATGRGALPLPRPGDFRCTYACILVGTNDAMAMAATDAFTQLSYVDTKSLDMPRLPPDWQTAGRPSLELYEASLRAAVRDLRGTGAQVAIATPPPLAEDLADAPPEDRHVRRPPFRVVSEMADAVRRVAADEDCEVLPLFECFLHRLRQAEGNGRRLLRWAPRPMFDLQRQAQEALHLAKGPGGGWALPAWEDLIPEPTRPVLSHNMVELNESGAAIYAALVQAWLDGKLQGDR